MRLGDRGELRPSAFRSFVYSACMRSGVVGRMWWGAAQGDLDGGKASDGWLCCIVDVESCRELSVVHHRYIDQSEDLKN